MTDKDKIAYLKEMRNALSNANMYARDWDDAVDEAIKDIEFKAKAGVVIEQLRADRDRLATALEEIRAEIVELTKCPYDTACLGANCPSNTDCMICGDHVLQIIDKHRKEEE